MDHFEIEEQMDDEERDRLATALGALKAGAMLIAEKFGLCPICLIYALADSAADAEEAGLVQHAGGTQH